MIERFTANAYKKLRTLSIVQRMLPLSNYERLEFKIGKQKAEILERGVRGFCEGSPVAMGTCATELDRLGGILGFTDAPMLGVLLARSTEITLKRFEPKDGVPPELEELLELIRLVLPKQHIIPSSARHELRIGTAAK